MRTINAAIIGSSSRLQACALEPGGRPPSPSGASGDRRVFLARRQSLRVAVAKPTIAIPLPHPWRPTCPLHRRESSHWPWLWASSSLPGCFSSSAKRPTTVRRRPPIKHRRPARHRRSSPRKHQAAHHRRWLLPQTLVPDLLFLPSTNARGRTVGPSGTIPARAMRAKCMSRLPVRHRHPATAWRRARRSPTKWKP